MENRGLSSDLGSCRHCKLPAAMKISVVTPSYNQAKFVQRTLDSVLGQDYANVEYIVVDGCSNDGSIELLEDYRDRLQHLIIEPDDGQADAIRKGFELASGDLLCFLNSDDLLLPGCLTWVAEFFESNAGIDAIYSHRVFIDENDQPTKFWTLPPHFNYGMSRWDFIPQETCFWRRSLMVEAGGIDPDYQFALDYDLFVRMMKLGKFKRVHAFLAAFRVHADAKSSTLYETLGREEVDKVRIANDVGLHWYDVPLKYLFGGTILGTSWLFRIVSLSAFRERIKFID